jgi:hypothetical protein
MAAPLPPAIGPAVVPVALYRNFFSDAANDPFNGDYAACLAPYAVPTATALTAEEVFALAINCRSQNVPTAFIIQHEDTMDLHIYTQLDHFYPRMGLPTTPWDDLSFISKGELHHNQQVLVQWEDDYFTPTQQLRLPSVALLDAEHANNPNLVNLGPYTAHDADTESMRVRHTCYVPPAYVPLFLSGPITPHHAWTTVRAQIETDGRMNDCMPLINFIRAAFTRVTAQNHYTGVSITAPTAPLADATLLNRRRAILESDFPSLNQNLAALQQHQIAGQLGQLVTESRITRQANAARDALKKNKPVDQCLGPVGTIRLLRYCNLPNAAALPPFWAQISRSPKQQHLSILQWEVNRIKQILNEPDLPFVVSASILESVKSLQWEMVSNDAVDTGLNVFLLADELMTDSLSHQAMYELMHSDGAAPTLADATTLIKAKAGAPRMIYQSRQQAKRMEILLMAIMGELHPLPASYNEYNTRLTSSESSLHLLQAEHLLLPTMLCKKLAVSTSNWFKYQASSPAPHAVPNLCAVFEKIDNEEPWKPVMAPTFMSKLGLSTLHPLPPNHPTPTLPHILTVPGGPSPPNGPPNPAPTITRNNNTHFNTTLFQAYKTSSTACRTLRYKIRDNAIPDLPVSKIDQLPMCLAWHCKGMCNENCGRSPDHVRYTAGEYAPLVQWCSSHFPTS